MGQIIDPVTCSHRFKHGPICPGQFDHFDPVGFGGAKGCNGHVSAEFAGFKGLGGQGARFVRRGGRFRGGLGFHVLRGAIESPEHVAI